MSSGGSSGDSQESVEVEEGSLGHQEYIVSGQLGDSVVKEAGGSRWLSCPPTGVVDRTLT